MTCVQVMNTAGTVHVAVAMVATTLLQTQYRV